MMANFNDVFNPTLEVRIKSALHYLDLCKQAVENRWCATCKHSEVRPKKMHSHDTTVTYCTKHNRYEPKTCDDYDLASITIKKEENK